MSKIITISRQFGSGGREIGRKLSEKLGYAYFDKELITAVAEQTGLSAEYVEIFSESHSVKNTPYLFGRTFITYQESPAEQIQIVQHKILNELAEKGDCVIIGRCADYILREQNPFKLFIYSSSMDAKLERCYAKVPAEKGTSNKQMIKQINEVDKKRSKYYEYYTSQKWAEVENYNLCIDTARFSIDKAIDIIVNAVK